MTEIKGQKDSRLTGMSRVSYVFLENSTFLKKFLRRFLYQDQDIEDVVQETYIKACKAERIKDIGHPKAYLFSIAKNLALNELGRKSRKMTDFIEECEAANMAEPSESLEEYIQAEESVALYCKAASLLPERCRRVYLLRKVHGLSHKEIAERLDISLSAVSKHLSKGMLSCQKYIEKGGDQTPTEFELRLQARAVAMKRKED